MTIATHRPPRKVAGFTWGRVEPNAAGLRNFENGVKGY